MNSTTFAGRSALVTGASSGLGADFARQLAAAGANLILTARRKGALEALADEIRGRHAGTSVHVIPLDLATPEAVETLAAEIQARHLVVDILINNAGFGAFGRFDEIPWEKENSMLQLDIVTLVKATKVFSAGMKQRGWGRILQVSSIGAFQPTPLYAAYSAGKAFVLSYGVAVNQELKGTGVSCTVLSPGVTATEFLKVAEQKPTLYQRAVMMSSPAVVNVGLKALAARRKSAVPGWGNKASAVMVRFLSRGLAARLAEVLMK